VRAALLSSFRYDWAASILLSAPNIAWHTFGHDTLPVRTPDDPFALPLADTADVTLVSTLWYEWLEQHHPEKVEKVLHALRQRSRLVVGLDAGDEFALSLPPRAFDHFDLVLKAQGLYKDRELYNYEVGAHFPGGNWTQKLRPREAQYPSTALEKLRLSVPCIMLDIPAVRRHARLREATAARTLSEMLPAHTRILHNAAETLIGLANPHMPIGHRSQDVHCLVQLSHIQRLEALELLTEFSGTKGIAGIPGKPQGTEYGWNLPAAELDTIRKRAAPFSHRPLGRARFLFDLSHHKVGVAPTGYGELGQRHGAVMLAGAALICQDLSHVEMLFPIENGVNAVFCKPDLSDLRDTVRDVLSDDEGRRRVARQGRDQLVRWGRRWRQTLFQAVEQPLLELLEPASRST
jgi:hypothetical protein